MSNKRLTGKKQTSQIPTKLIKMIKLQNSLFALHVVLHIFFTCTELI